MPKRSPHAAANRASGRPHPLSKTIAKPIGTKQLPTKMLWEGPESTGPNGGITSSMLAKFITCRERFRLYTVYGYKAEDEFDHKIEFGNFWHHAKETWRAKGDWREAITEHKHYLMSIYPAKADIIEQWAYLAAGVFRVWLSLPGKCTNTKEVLQEVPFKVPYKLPPGRTVILRGKYDSIIAIGKNLYIEDDKSKGFIDDEGISATIDGNLQMGFYHTAARQSLSTRPWAISNLVIGSDYPAGINMPGSGPYKFAGTRYNVVRRPLAERNPVRKRKAETDKKFWDRVIAGVKANPDYYFIPKTAEISKFQMERYQQRILNPWLESLCDWYDWVSIDPDDPWRDRKASELLSTKAVHLVTDKRKAVDQLAKTIDKLDPTGFQNSLHFQTPWGVFNSLFGGFRGDYFTLLTKGSDNGLKRVSTLFPELQ